uniref:C2H2-type domain-containing protein n=1 Tax=Eptatretus burgeri TaxID=7764 RepID=A0A8C4R7R9_EPTBU
MDQTRARGGPGPVPTWMEIQGLPEESLRATVTGLGIEILGALCARAEPPTVRVRLCSLSARKFTYTMYAELCQYMESCRAGRGSERTVVAGRGKTAEGRPGGVVRIKVKEEEGSLGPPEGRDPEHVIRDNQIGRFPCSSCSHSFTNEAALKTHTKKHRPDSREKEYKFTEYPFHAHNQSHLVRRAEIPTKTSYACTECGKEFDNASHRNIHMLLHNRDRPHKCSLCGKAFVQSSPYRIHMRRHMGERPYSCELCPKTFSNRSDLIRHLRVHTGEKPYTCSVCGKGFNQSTSQQIHMRIHTGERPYICSECGKAFGHPSSFRKHVKIHNQAAEALLPLGKNKMAGCNKNMPNNDNQSQKVTKETQPLCRLSPKFVRPHRASGMCAEKVNNCTFSSEEGDLCFTI